MINEITLLDILNWCVENIIQIFVFLSVFIEITPIKINPISFCLNLLFKPIKSEIANLKSNMESNINNIKNEIKEDINEIKQEQEKETKTIQQIKETQDLIEISRLRWEIIEFSNSIENGNLHKRDEYRHILDNNKKYHELLNKYGLENGIIDEEIDSVRDHFEKNRDSTQIYI